MAPPTVLASLCHQYHVPLLPFLLLLLLLLLALELLLAAAVCTSATGVEQHDTDACTLLPQLLLLLTACSYSASISGLPLLLPQSAASAALLVL
jgi:hypothetical protein